jgi:ankyrin repeat protein
MITLIEAAKIGDLEQVKLLISDIKNIEQAFICAAQYGYLEVVKLLIHEGADIHASNDLALLYAAQYGYLEIVKLLIHEGADIHASNDRALLWAARHGHLEVVKLLIHEGANIHANNDCILRWTKYGEHLDIVKYLVLNGADIRSYIFHDDIKKNILDFLLSKIVPIEIDYSIDSRIYKLLPNEHKVKKMIDHIIAMRALSSKRLHKSLVKHDITIICCDP